MFFYSRNYIKSFKILILTYIFLAIQTNAEERFFVTNKTLFYNSEIETSNGSFGIIFEDIDDFKMLLEQNLDITKVSLTSYGGFVEAAYEIADLILDYNLDTHLEGDCESACTILFLAGNKRTAKEDSKLGFHQTSYSEESAKEEYESMKDEMNFNSPFAYAAWVLEDTQEMILNDLYFYQGIGMSLDFFIKTLEAPSDEMWYPDHSYLREEGIITD